MKKGYNFPDAPASGLEHPKGKSMTVPNQALSIRDIMERSLRGAMLSEVAHNRLEYGDDEDYDDEMPTEMDLSDMDVAAEQIDAAKARINEHAQRKNQSAKKVESDSADVPSPSAE